MSLEELMETGLPMNRKERFFTGTVFPMIVGMDNFAHFDRFTALIEGYVQQPLRWNPADANVQLFTEYGIAESIYGNARERFTDPPTDRDTPDVLIYIEGQPRVLIGLEAKLYLAPSASSLQMQMDRQEKVLNYLANELHIDTVHHYALLPGQWLPALNDFPFQIMTWQALHDQFKPVGPDNYYLHMLRLALEAWDDLVSKSSGGRTNADAMITGLEILERYRNGQLPFATMGREYGIDGATLQEDIQTGNWREQPYEVSYRDEPANRNWFLIEEFIAMIEEADS